MTNTFKQDREAHGFFGMLGIAIKELREMRRDHYDRKHFMDDQLAAARDLDRYMKKHPERFK